MVAPAASGTSMARRKREGGPLNRERIAAAALELVDREGLANLSTRKLGARLGVEGMAIYRHFPSMEALLDALAERLFLQVPIPPPQPGGWKARLRRYARDYRNIALRHPKAHVLLATRRFNTPRSLNLLDALLGGLLEEGFTPRQAVEVFRAVGNYCTGSSLDELAGRAYAREHGAQRMPGAVNLEKVSRWLEPGEYEGIFEAGLEALITGLAAQTRR